MSLEIATRNLDVAKGGEYCVGNVVDGNAVDRDEHVSGLFAKWPGKV